MARHPQPPDDVVERLSAICLALAGAREHSAWTGTSWRVKDTTFAHVVEITDGWPAAYAQAFDTSGPATVVTFQADPEEREALVQQGHPFHAPPWRPGIVGLIIGPDTDWDELAELIVDSHQRCSPRPK